MANTTTVDRAAAMLAATPKVEAARDAAGNKMKFSEYTDAVSEILRCISQKKRGGLGGNRKEGSQRYTRVPAARLVKPGDTPTPGLRRTADEGRVYYMVDPTRRGKSYAKWDIRQTATLNAYLTSLSASTMISASYDAAIRNRELKRAAKIARKRAYDKKIYHKRMHTEQREERETRRRENTSNGVSDPERRGNKTSAYFTRAEQATQLNLRNSDLHWQSGYAAGNKKGSNDTTQDLIFPDWFVADPDLFDPTLSLTEPSVYIGCPDGKFVIRTIPPGMTSTDLYEMATEILGHDKFYLRVNGNYLWCGQELVPTGGVYEITQLYVEEDELPSTSVPIFIRGLKTEQVTWRMDLKSTAVCLYHKIYEITGNSQFYVMYNSRVLLRTDETLEPYGTYHIIWRILGGKREKPPGPKKILQRVANRAIKQEFGIDVSRTATELRRSFKKSKGGRRMRGRGMGAMITMGASAPAALAFETKTEGPTTRVANGVTRVTNRILIGTVTGSTTFDNAPITGANAADINASDLLISPVNEVLFQTALPDMAKNFEYFRFRELALQYVPSVGSATPGRIMMVHIKDAAIPIPDDIISMSNIVGQHGIEVWKPLSINAATSSTWLHVNQYINGTDRLFTHDGRFAVATAAGEADACGFLYVEYVCELTKPFTPVMTPACTRLTSAYLDTVVALVEGQWNNTMSTASNWTVDHDGLELKRFFTNGGFSLPPGAYEIRWQATIDMTTIDDYTISSTFAAGTPATADASTCQLTTTFDTTYHSVFGTRILSTSGSTGSALRLYFTSDTTTGVVVSPYITSSMVGIGTRVVIYGA